MEDHAELVERARTDEQAFTELYHAYIDEMYLFVFRRVGHRENTEELVSDIFRKVFLHLHSFDGSRASFRTWLYRIAGNAVIDFYRVQRNKNRPNIVDIDVAESVIDPMTPDQIVLTQEQQAYIQSCIAQLSAKQQQIIQYKFFDGFSHDEIAEMLQMTPNNVGVTAHRALKKMKLILQSTPQ